MSGKKPTLISKEFMAKIQREFPPPKVFAVNLSITTGIPPISKDIPARITASKPPTATGKNYLPHISSFIRSKPLVDRPCLTVQPPPDTSVKVQNVPCFDLDGLQAKPIETKIPYPQTHTPKSMSIPVKIVPLETLISAPHLHGKVDTVQVSVKTEVKSGKVAKISFPLTLMKYLSLQQFIHYRSATLKKTAKKNHEIEFLGVCQVIPPVVLSFDSLKTSEDTTYTIGIPCGAPDPQLENQVWVIYRLIGSEEVFALTIQALG